MTLTKRSIALDVYAKASAFTKWDLYHGWSIKRKKYSINQLQALAFCLPVKVTESLINTHSVSTHTHTTRTHTQQDFLANAAWRPN